MALQHNFQIGRSLALVLILNRGHLQQLAASHEENQDNCAGLKSPQHESSSAKGKELSNDIALQLAVSPLKGVVMEQTKRTA
jgi:hypothetical protein